jgi:F0F1-type ATP synthase membrane subunit b/b'
MKSASGLFILILLGISSPALASGGGGHGFALKEHGFYILNFLIFLGIVIAFAREPLKKGLADRADAFARRLEDARQKHDETLALLGSAEQKMAGLGVEKESLLKRMETDAVKQKEDIAQKTVEEGKKIRASARKALENEKNRLDRKFQSELALASLSRAEELVAEQWKSLPHGTYVEQFATAIGEEPRVEGGQ